MTPLKANTLISIILLFILLMFSDDAMSQRRRDREAGREDMNPPKPIFCFGTAPYIAHGYLGAELVREAGFPRHALVCERHTGAGLSLDEILRQQLPVPHRDMLPVSLEEQVICFADKFFSKTHLEKEKTVDGARKSIAKYGEEGLTRFNHWCDLFL